MFAPKKTPLVTSQPQHGGTRVAILINLCYKSLSRNRGGTL